MTNPKANAALVEALGSALREGEHGLKTGPALLVRVLREESWRSFVTQRGEEVENRRFEDFVATPPLKGLGATMRLIDKLIESIEDSSLRADAQNLLDVALQRGHGGDRRSDHLRFKLDNIQLENETKVAAPSGTSRDAGLRRLRKDRPDLHAEVLAGRLSTHAAMVEAGFRRRKISIPIGAPADAAKALRRNLEPDQIKELVELLVADD
ncbi:hypothetical protein ACFXAW_07110 [Streptomyces sp. NPDC059445]|uniref:hypothetical protein n=1 Tax=Streptomyces sp. NPDC059445 TaxID=3346832 RepID=UPI0036B67A36